MGRQSSVELSVVLPFGDDEDLIGKAVRRVADHLRQHRIEFELLAVDEDSGDNSHAILALLRQDLPELAITSASARGRGMASGAQRARGRVLWLLDPAAAMAPLAAFSRAYRRVSRGDVALVSVDRRFTVCYRTHCLSAIAGARGGRGGFHRRLAKRARAARHSVEVQALGGAGAHNPRIAGRSWSRLFGAIVQARS